jgi:mRNA-degrading endonuclease RelE of RelBE toxin-antitoxin system
LDVGGEGPRSEGTQPGRTRLMVYLYEFLKSAEREFLALPKRHQKLFRDKLTYLSRNPYKSYPWLRVRQGARHPGEWRFHLNDYRVFFRVDGSKIVFTRILRRPRSYPRRPPKLPKANR